MTDEAILGELGERLSRYRLSRDLTQADLAREAGVSKRTVARIEAGASTQVTNLIRIIRALGLIENLGAVVPPPLPSPMEQLRNRGKERQRASGRRPAPAAEWTWGEST